MSILKRALSRALLLSLTAILFISTIPANPVHQCPSTEGTENLTLSHPWPMFRHDLNHTGRSPYDTSGNNGQLLWKFQTDDYIGFSSPAIASDGSIYVGSQDGNLYALFPNGTLKWKYATGNHGYKSISSPAIGADGTIHFGAYDENIYALHPNGSAKWTFPAQYIVSSSPAVSSEGIIYIGSHDNNLYAINPDGSQKWIFAASSSILSSPAVALDGTIYVGSWGGLYAINPNGNLKWFYPVHDIIWSSPSIAADGTVYVGSHSSYNNVHGYLYAFSPNGTLRWKFLLPGHGTHSSPAIDLDGTIYIGATDYYYNFFAINPNGTQKWNFSTKSYVHSSPAISSDGTIHFGSYDKNVYALYPNGSLKWKYTAGDMIDSSPSIAPDGTIYIGCSDGALYAIGHGEEGPVANAGPDQTVHEGEVVQFNGSGESSSYMSWAAEKNIKVTNSTRSYTGCLYGCTVDSVTAQDGTLHVVWREEEIAPGLTRSRLYYAFSNDSLTFSRSRSVLPEDWVGGHVALAVDFSGRIHIAFDGGPPEKPVGVSYVYYTVSEDGGLHFHSPMYVGEGSDPDIQLDQNGMIHIAFGNVESPDSWGVYWTVSTGPFVFSPPKLLSIGHDYGFGTPLIPSLVVDSSDRVHVAWTEYRYYHGATPGYQVWFSHSTDNGSTFQSIAVVNRSKEIGDNTHLVIDSNGNPRLGWHVRYTGLNNRNCSLGLIESTNGGIGFQQEKISPFASYRCPTMCYASHIRLAVDSRDRIHGTLVAYPENETGYKEIGVYHFQRNEDGTVSQMLKVNDDSTGNKRNSPSISIAFPDRIDVFWRDNRHHEDIYYSKIGPVSLGNLTFTWDMNDYVDTDGNGNYTDDVDATGQTPTWIYGDDGLYAVTLKVTDELGNWDIDMMIVNVLNAAPEVIANYTCTSGGSADILLRIAGEKWHDVSFTIHEYGNEIYNETVMRIPGSPNEQMIGLHDFELNASRSYSTVARYTPEDDRANGQPNGATPAWIILRSGGKEIARLHHTFNVRHPDTWIWRVDGLRSYFPERECTFTAYVTDPGSDDLNLTWNWGDGTTTGHFYYNDGVGPDPYPSPDVNPISVTDTARHSYASAGTYTIILTVRDDDGGVVTQTLVLDLF